MAKIGIFIGTVYGNALLVAEEAESILRGCGHEVALFEDATLEAWRGYQQDWVLVITSTTGQGDLPESIVPLFAALREKGEYQPTLRYGLIALGDSSYEHFCGGGRKFDDLLQKLGAKRVGDALAVDAAENPEPETVAIPWVERWSALIEAE